jgi:hypothetical protein
MQRRHAVSALARLALVLAALLSTMHAQRAAAEELMGPVAEATPEQLAFFTESRWSLVFPERDYEGGCVVGFLAFQFHPAGYFTFNNRVRGVWRIDGAGNLRMRTRDGVFFQLIVEGPTLRPARNLPFLRRTDVYQRCDD